MWLAQVDQPPWVATDAFNGCMLFLLDLAGSRIPGVTAGQRALFLIVPFFIVCVQFGLGILRKADLDHNARWSKRVEDSRRPWHTAAITTAYSVLENALLVSGIVSLLELEQPSWGVMTCIPLFVLCLVSLPPGGSGGSVTMRILVLASAILVFFGWLPRSYHHGPPRDRYTLAPEGSYSQGDWCSYPPSLSLGWPSLGPLLWVEGPGTPPGLWRWQVLAPRCGTCSSSAL